MTGYEESARKITLPTYVYQKIERTVAELFARLSVRAAPINPFEIARKLGHELVPFSALSLDAARTLRKMGKDGTSHYDPNNRRFVIYYDDCVSVSRARFTVMHEIGHILLEHRADSELAEVMANCFAAYALAPTPLIALYGCEDYIDIERRFAVSSECAMYRFDAFRLWCRYSKNVDYEDTFISLFGEHAEKQRHK